jgi:BirA family biotin operon repressor/biotin-[acetyl-CoA-carboxylase] ligase
MSDGIDWKVHTYASLPSSQDYVRELVEDEDEFFPEGTVVQALSQTKGRGRHGRQWESPLGNLYMSLLLRPDCDAATAGQISFVIAVALSAAIGQVLRIGHDKKLKWPNDILIDGKKCAGILLESELNPDGGVKAIIVGMGVNIHGAPEGAVGLQQVTDEITVPVNKFRDIALARVSDYYRQWQKEGFAPIRELWLKQAANLGAEITVKLGEKQFQGIFRDLDAGGTLKLVQNDGKVLDITSGDVYI